MNGIKFLSAWIILVSAFAGLAFAHHEDVASSSNISVVNGVNILNELDLTKLNVCAGCGYTIVDQPDFDTVAQANSKWGSDELVLGVEFNGVIKAYPLPTLSPVRFHVLNDDFNGTPLAVSFCPLCFSGVVFERPTIDGQVLSFATAGLFSRDLVMYDNVTGSLWQQFTGEALAGPIVGETGLLHRVPADIVPYSDWVAAHPDSLIYVDSALSSSRRSNETIEELVIYESIASGTRDSSREADRDQRLPDREIVVGITIQGQAKAYRESSLLSTQLINDTLGNTSILVVVDPISNEIKFFEREVNGQILSFSLNGGELTDQQTGSTWRFDGIATSGSLSGTTLKEIAGLPSFWFAWVTFHPRTELFS